MASKEQVSFVKPVVPFVDSLPRILVVFENAG
jgi:hypothetical protein